MWFSLSHHDLNLSKISTKDLSLSAEGFVPDFWYLINLCPREAQQDQVWRVLAAVAGGGGGDTWWHLHCHRCGGSGRPPTCRPTGPSHMLLPTGPRHKIRPSAPKAAPLATTETWQTCWAASCDVGTWEMAYPGHPFHVPMFPIPSVTWASALGSNSVGKFPNPKSVLRICKCLTSSFICVLLSGVQSPHMCC